MHTDSKKKLKDKFVKNNKKDRRCQSNSKFVEDEVILRSCG
jgi:hypothetical protein